MKNMCQKGQTMVTCPIFSQDIISTLLQANMSWYLPSILRAHMVSLRISLFKALAQLKFY